MAMKQKKPGDHIILRLKNTESPLILEWINRQSNLSDAIRYLIEEEIKAHAVRDLQEHIPAKRKPLQVAAEQAAGQEDAAAVQPVGRPEQAPLQRAVDAYRDNKEAAVAASESTAKDAKPPEQQPGRAASETDDDEGEYSDEIIDHWLNL